MPNPDTFDLCSIPLDLTQVCDVTARDYRQQYLAPAVKSCDAGDCGCLQQYTAMAAVPTSLVICEEEIILHLMGVHVPISAQELALSLEFTACPKFFTMQCWLGSS